MHVGCAIHPVARLSSVTVTLGFVALLRARLTRLHIPRRRAEDILCMIAQCEWAGFHSGPHAARKGFPFDENGFNILQDEISQPHDQSFVPMPMPHLCL